MHATPTEQDKLEDLWRQCDNFERKEAANIICPWCFKMNKPGIPQCCGFFAEGLEKRGRHQFNLIVTQMREVHAGHFRSIKCPYCHTRIKIVDENTHPSEWVRPLTSPFCCDLMHDAATAIVERKMLERLIEDKKRIEDKVTKN